MRKPLVVPVVAWALASCVAYRETANQPIRKPLIFAEFHEGGMLFGRPKDPLSAANWELRISASGEIQQRAYDSLANAWRTFVAKPLPSSQLVQLVSLCERLPEQGANEEPLYLGRVATDTTFLHIMFATGNTRRDVYLYAPEDRPLGSEPFFNAWRAISRVRPVPQTPNGG